MLIDCRMKTKNKLLSVWHWLTDSQLKRFIFILNCIIFIIVAVWYDALGFLKVIVIVCYSGVAIWGLYWLWKLCAKSWEKS